MFNPKLLFQCFRFLFTFFLFLFIQQYRKHDIFFYRKAVHQIKILKYKSDLSTSDIRKFFFPQLIRIHTVKDHISVRLLIHKSQDIQKCCLSTAGFSHNSDVLSLFYIKVNAFQYRNRIRIINLPTGFWKFLDQVIYL